MSRFDLVDRRYAASARIVQEGVEIVAVGDPAGARFDIATRRLIALERESGIRSLDDLLGAARMLRWRRICQPQPCSLNSSVQNLVEDVTQQVLRLRGAIEDDALLDELGAAAGSLAEIDSEIGPTLLRSIEEVGVGACVVVAMNRPTAAGLAQWLRDYGALILTAGELQRERPDREQAYVVGPPRLFPSSLVTAPVTEAVSYLLPAWFHDRTVPRSAIASYAEGAIRIKTRLFVVGDAAAFIADSPGGDYEDEYPPRPVWIRRDDGEREPAAGEIEARKLLLSGSLAMWLDDGDRIRTLDPGQPPGERVTFTDVAMVRVGSCLLVRQGESERSALYRAALAEVSDAVVIERSQAAWKQPLAEQIDSLSFSRVVRQLRDAGVVAADRARAWTDPNLIRPNSDQDFVKLLEWLRVPAQPAFERATRLRRVRNQVSARVRKQLEDAVSAVGLSELDETGHLSLGIETEGFRGIMATRVLAISPYKEPVPRRDVRVPFKDRSGLWLE